MDALLDAVDVAWICTWTAGHLPAVEAAVARGLPVFCEKPLAPTLADCRRIAELLATVPAPGRARAAPRAGVPRRGRGSCTPGATASRWR